MNGDKTAAPVLSAHHAEVRDRVGPRETGRNEHYALCDGTTCPCYIEGQIAVIGTPASGEFLDLCGYDPELLNEIAAIVMRRCGWQSLSARYGVARDVADLIDASTRDITDPPGLL